MVDKQIMRTQLENMERAAQETLQHDAAFFEALHALKSEIDNDFRVQSIVRNLQAAGSAVFNSFVPRIKIRIRTGKGVFSLPRRTVESQAAEGMEPLIQALRDAASDVIASSRFRRELDVIVNEAIAASDSFERVAREIERAGYQVLICLDLSAYAQVRQCSPSQCATEGLPMAQDQDTDSTEAGETPSTSIALSNKDLAFLKAMKIRAD